MTGIVAIIVAGVIAAGNPAERLSLALDIYNRDLALVRDVRRVEISAGPNRVDFPTISPDIFGHTSNIRVVDDRVRERAGLATVTLSYNYDFVSSEKMMKRFIGQWFAFSADDASYAGRLLHFDEWHLFLQPDTSEGFVQVVERGKLKEMYYPDLPEGLFTRPTLRWEVKANRKASDVEVEINYLTGGITWMCDYRGVLTDDGYLELGANFTISNDLTIPFPAAKVALVAGKLHKSNDPETGTAGRAEEARSGAVQGETSGRRITGERMDEYYRYALAEPIDLYSRQTISAPYFAPVKIKVERRYVFPHVLDAREVMTQIRFVNDRATFGEANPLPEGDIGLYRRLKEGGVTFVGEDYIAGVPTGGRVELNVGQAFDMTARRVRLADTRPARDRREETWQVEVVSGREKAATVWVEQRVAGYYNLLNSEVDGKAVTPEVKDANRLMFPVEVAANGTAVLTFSLAYGW